MKLNETSTQKAIRMGLGLFIVAAATAMWFYDAQMHTGDTDHPINHPHLPIWVVALGWIFGAGLAFSTVVRGLAQDAFGYARAILPFLNRRSGRRSSPDVEAGRSRRRSDSHSGPHS